MQRVRARELLRPLHVGAHDADLVPDVLLPVHRSRAPAGGVSIDGVRGASRQDDDAGLAAHRIVQVAAEILCPHVDVDDDDLWPSRHREVAVRCGQRHALEERCDDARHALAPRLERDDGLLQRRRVRSRIEEQALDAKRGEELEDGFRAVARISRGPIRLRQRLSIPRSAALFRNESSRIFATSKSRTFALIAPSCAFESAKYSTFGYGNGV